MALEKLNLYINMTEASVRVSGIHYHLQFLIKERLLGKGFSSFESSDSIKSLKCTYCKQNLIEPEQL